MASAISIGLAHLTSIAATDWRSPPALGKISLSDESNPYARKENAHGQVYWVGRPRVKLHRCGRRAQRPAAASHVVETNARAIVSGHPRPIPKDRHLCLEEGTLAGWLYEILTSHVQEIVVTGVPQSRGPKNDKRDAFALAEMLRIGATPAKVYKKRGQFTRLAYLAKAYQILVADDVRVQNRIKSVLRSRGVKVAGSAVYSATPEGSPTSTACCRRPGR